MIWAHDLRDLSQNNGFIASWQMSVATESVATDICQLFEYSATYTVSENSLENGMYGSESSDTVGCTV